MFERDGLTRKEISKQVEVSEKTIGKWVENGKWKSSVLDERRLRAKNLVQLQGYTFRDAAKDIGVSSATIGKWAKKGFWELGPQFSYPTKQQRRYVLSTFIKMVTATRPDLRELLESFSTTYNNQLEHKDAERLENN